MKATIKVKVSLYIWIFLFSFTGLSAYGYKAEKQSGENSIIWLMSKMDTIQENAQSNDEQDPYIRDIEHLKKMFRQRAVDEISENIAYPLKRTSPIPSVKNATELKERFHEIFDEYLIRIILNSDIDQWSKMGWRGIMLDDGILWMDYDGKIKAVNYQSEYEKSLQKELTSKEKSGLYRDLRRDFKGDVYKFKTKNYFIRIDELKNGTYRYACWKKENPESTRPDLVLGNGKIEYSGNGGNHVITFRNNIYEYKVFRNIIDAQGIPDISLVVKKNGKEILSEDGELEDDTVQSD